MKRAALLLACLCAGEATAFGRAADLQVIDRSTGQALQVYDHGGRHYIAGEPGHEYRLVLSSREGGRIMAVGSVDGVNIVTGETASTNQDGYVLAPWQQMSIDGWRTSLQSTAAFYFTTVADSYAGRTGRPDDLGVIGFALFREKAPCCDWLSRRDNVAPQARAEADAQAPAPAASAESRSLRQKDQRLGTGYGRSEHSEVSYTGFEPASRRPEEMITIYYDSYQNLCRRGIIPVPSARPPHPRPFPGGFVPPP